MRISEILPTPSTTQDVEPFFYTDKRHPWTGKVEILYSRTDQSVITRYVPGLSLGVETENAQIISMVNCSIGQLYLTAFSGISDQKLHFNRLMIDASVYLTDLLQWPGNMTISNEGLAHDPWTIANTYCYEARIDALRRSDRYQLMLEDLNSYFERFSLTGEMTTSKRQVLALVRTDTSIPIACLGHKPKVSWNSQTLKLQSVSLSNFIHHVNLMHPDQSEPIIDLTQYTELVDMEITGNMADLRDINKSLSNYGLTFKPLDHKVEMVVLKQTNG